MVSLPARSAKRRASVFPIDAAPSPYPTPCYACVERHRQCSCVCHGLFHQSVPSAMPIAGCHGLSRANPPGVKPANRVVHLHRRAWCHGNVTSPKGERLFHDPRSQSPGATGGSPTSALNERALTSPERPSDGVLLSLPAQATALGTRAITQLPASRTTAQRKLTHKSDSASHTFSPRMKHETNLCHRRIGEALNLDNRLKERPNPLTPITWRLL